MHETVEQVRSRQIRDMGDELGSAFSLLQNDMIWLHARWKQYRQLYARSPERVDFLNKVAGHFFGVLQNTLYEDVLLKLARLTDPPRFGLSLRSVGIFGLVRRAWSADFVGFFGMEGVFWRENL